MRAGPLLCGALFCADVQDNRQTVNLAIEGSCVQETPIKSVARRRVAWTTRHAVASLTRAPAMRTVDRSQVCRLEPDEEADFDQIPAPGSRATVLQMQRMSE